MDTPCSHVRLHARRALWQLAFAVALLVSSRGAAFAAAPAVDVPLLAASPAAGDPADPSWSAAAKLSLDQDFTYRHAADETTAVSVAQDGAALDVAFVVTQRAAITAGQETNGGSVLSDDYVGVFLWPQGTQGFGYSFEANARGTRYQTSSENAAYTPEWTAVARRIDGGYAVTMRIPFNVIRSGGSSVWRAQFVRTTVATNAFDVWTFEPRQQNAADPAFAGQLRGIGVTTAAARPKPRAQIYGLGELTTPANGGSTSRIGGDFSLPVSPTISFLGTLHPDYSNVEVDQQTIAPSAFAYQYSDVRPFFTQAGQPFNYTLACNSCPTLLYTPAIPTFREGYALEGTVGKLTFSGFDAIGNGRADQGQAFDYLQASPERTLALNVQRVGVDAAGGFHDDLTSVTTGILDQRTHLLAYANGAIERGTDVTDASRAGYVEYGVGYTTATSLALVNYQRIGSQFAPPDSYVAQNDIGGYESIVRKTFNFSPKALVRDITGSAYATHFEDDLGHPAQVSGGGQISVDFRGLFSFHAFANHLAVGVNGGPLLPFDQNGVYVGYRASTVTPSYVLFTEGPYYHGRLGAWQYLTTLPVRRRINLRLEADEDDYFTQFPGEAHTVQWLERASVDWQINKNSSFDVGARRIIGGNIPNIFTPPGQYFTNAGNVTAAYHFLAFKNEFYIVYGDPNSLSTTPALFLKWIRYVGAQKGT